MAKGGMWSGMADLSRQVSQSRVMRGARAAGDWINTTYRKVPRFAETMRPVDHARWGLTDAESQAMTMLDLARRGRANDVQEIIEKGALPDLRVPSEKLPAWVKAPKEHGTFLHWAAATVKESKSMHRISLASENPNATRSDGHTPLSIAAMRGEIKVMESLAMTGADMDQRINGEEMSVAVARSGGFKGAKMLRENGIPYDLRFFRDNFHEQEVKRRNADQKKNLAKGEAQWQESTAPKVVHIGAAQHARLAQKRAAVPAESREAAVQRIASLKAHQAKRRAEMKSLETREKDNRDTQR